MNNIEMLRNLQRRVKPLEVRRTLRDFYRTFDSHFYRSAHSFGAKLFPRIHYLLIGQARGFDPSPSFAAGQYQKIWPNNYKIAYWDCI